MGLLDGTPDAHILGPAGPLVRRRLGWEFP
jgi:hypothetical protein